MDWVTSIADSSVLLFYLLLLAAQIIVYRLGLWVGRRAQARRENVEAVGLVVGTLLGLLTFVLALTLSFANSRYVEHRQGTLVEANAIGTAWLRARAIGGPHADAIAGLVEEYAGVRASFVAAGRSDTTIGALNQRTGVLQTHIWQHLSTIVREQPNPVSAALMTSLNEMFDAGTRERFAYHIKLPSQLFWLLMGMTLLSMGCLGYQLGLSDKPSHVLVVVLTAMWTWVIVEILDLASARVGHIRTETAVYDWTIQGFKGNVVSPAMPP